MWLLEWHVPFDENSGGIVTSQVLVMNMSGIAIASDTVVTVVDGENNPLRTMPNSRKIIELGGKHKILVLNSDHSHITGIPVNVLIDSWANSLPEPLESLEEYRDSFLLWVPRVAVSSDEKTSFTSLLESEFRTISRAISVHCEDLWPLEPSLQERFEADESFKKRYVSRAGREINKYLSRFAAYESETIASGSSAAMAAEFGGASDLLDHWFPDNTLSTRTKARLRDALPKIIMYLPISQENATIAFTGFGTHDYFPKELTIEVESSFFGHVRWFQKSQSDAETARPAYVRWWAQYSNINSFFRGVHSDYLNHLLDEVIPETATRVLSENKISKHGARIGQELASQVEEEMGAWSNNYYSSLLFNLSTMDPIDLADAARTLLELETLGAHKNAGLATVGGEIEVATITLRDGVVWRSKLSA